MSDKSPEISGGEPYDQEKERFIEAEKNRLAHWDWVINVSSVDGTPEYEQGLAMEEFLINKYGRNDILKSDLVKNPKSNMPDARDVIEGKQALYRYRYHAKWE